MCDMGITDEDVSSFRALPEYSSAIPGYSVDILVSELDGNMVCSLRSLPPDTDGAGLSEITIIEGRLPINDNECLMDYKSEIPIGDKIIMSDQNKKKRKEMLKNHEFEIVGIVRSPEFISHERGNTTIGNGEIRFFAYVPASVFDSDYYTLIDLRLNSTDEIESAFSKEYEKSIETATESLESFTDKRAQIRYDDIITEAEDKIAKAEKKLKDKRDEADEKLADARADLIDGQRKIDDAQAEINDNAKKIKKGEKELSKGKKEIKKQENKLKEAERQYQEAIDSGIPPEYLTEQKAQIDKGKKALAGAKKELKDAEADLKTGKNKLKEAERKIETAKQDLRQGWADYEEAKEEADSEFKKAQKKIDKSKKKLDDIEKPEWFIQTRDDMPGFSGFADDANRIDNISLTITTFLYLVAALVCLTTMTRMVEEQRLQIGTFKALGYRRRKIVSKYFFYAILLSALGGIAGAILGLMVFPTTIWDAYSIMYVMDPISLAVRPSAVAIGILGGLAAVCIATTFACLNELKSPAAELMRPKAPKPGRRVLLERLKPLWKRLRFIDKVTARNLFRYKKRLIMTVIGITGCSALLLTGFGIKDSISGIADFQYGVVMQYDATFYLDEPSDSEDDSDLNDELSIYGKSIYFMQKNADASKGVNTSEGMPISIYVPEDPEKINDFISFRDRSSGKPVSFPPENTEEPSVVISEKLANTLMAEIGDTIKFGETDGKKQEAVLAGITENYIYNFIYITPADYKKLFAEEPEFNAVILMIDEDTVTGEIRGIDGIAESIIKIDNVISATTANFIRALVDNIVSNLSVVVWVIISVSGMLALIVLYNLTNINICERERELATLKVLGFYRKEISAYISKETLVLTMIGILLGLFAGVYLHRYLMAEVEVNDIMFGRVVKTVSYFYTGLFTLACAFVIRLIMQPKIDRIEPVVSLKSPE